VKKIKIAELVLLALSALVALGKWMIRFIEIFGKAQDKTAPNTA